MTKNTVLLFFLLIFYIPVYAQQSTDKGIAVSPGVNMPLGDFSSTHSFGITLDCSPTYHRFRLMARKDSMHLSRFAFTYNGGLSYYFEKNETVNGYPYKYPGYFFIHAFGGLLYVPGKNLTATLLAGPALGIYNGNTRFNIGARLETVYTIKPNLSAGPLINLMKEFGTDALWSAGIKMTIDL